MGSPKLFHLNSRFFIYRKKGSFEPWTANFLCAVRDCMAPGAVYVHFTEEPPDYRTEVIEAAFDAERWRIAVATVEDDDSVPNTYFRYSVWRREDVS